MAENVPPKKPDQLPQPVEEWVWDHRGVGKLVRRSNDDDDDDVICIDDFGPDQVDSSPNKDTPHPVSEDEESVETPTKSFKEKEQLAKSNKHSPAPVTYVVIIIPSSTSSESSKISLTPSDSSLKSLLLSNSRRTVSSTESSKKNGSSSNSRKSYSTTESSGKSYVSSDSRRSIISFESLRKSITPGEYSRASITSSERKTTITPSDTSRKPLPSFSTEKRILKPRSRKNGSSSDSRKSYSTTESSRKSYVSSGSRSIIAFESVRKSITPGEYSRASITSSERRTTITPSDTSRKPPSSVSTEKRIFKPWSRKSKEKASRRKYNSTSPCDNRLKLTDGKYIGAPGVYMCQACEVYALLEEFAYPSNLICSEICRKYLMQDNKVAKSKEKIVLNLDRDNAPDMFQINPDFCKLPEPINSKNKTEYDCTKKGTDNSSSESRMKMKFGSSSSSKGEDEIKKGSVVKAKEGEKVEQCGQKRKLPGLVPWEGPGQLKRLLDPDDELSPDKLKI